MKEILAKAGEIVVGDRNSIITAKALGSSLAVSYTHLTLPTT